MQEDSIQINIERKHLAFLASVTLHALVLFLSFKFPQNEPLLPSQETFVIENMSGEELSKLKDKMLEEELNLEEKILRTVGKKNGAKSANAIEILSPRIAGAKAKKAGFKLPKENAEKTQAKRILDKLAEAEKPKKLSIEQLKVEKVESQKEVSPIKKLQANLNSKLSQFGRFKLTDREIQNFFQGGDLLASQNNPKYNRLLGDSSLGIEMELPEGVDASELNRAELQFYSFQRRNAITFISSFFKTLDNFSIKKPQVRLPVNSYREIMSGRVTYDLRGNIREIKIFRSSNSEDMQQFFENVLEGMTLPNPPKVLIKNSDQFNMYYTIIVNG